MFMFRRRRLTALSSCIGSILALSSAAAAESVVSESAPEWSSTLDYVVITANRAPEHAQDVLLPVTIIDRNEIDRSLTTDVSQLLGQVPGIDITPYGGPGQNVSVFVRGTNSNHTVFLVDGIRINPGTIGEASLENLAPDLIDRVEIVKGPRSAIYGTDAIGGVINFVTREPQSNGGTASVGYGRYNTRNATGTLDLNTGDSSLLLTTRWLESDGFPQFAGDTQNRGYRNLSEALTGRTRLGAIEVTAHLWNAAGNTQYSDFGTPTDENYHDSIGALEMAGHITDHWQMLLRAGRMQDDLRQTAIDAYAATPQPDYETTNRVTLDWQNTMQVGGHTFAAGAMWMDESTRALVYGTTFDVTTHSTTGYLQDRVTVGSQHYSAAVGHTQHSTFGDHTTYSVEYGYDSSEKTLWTAGIGTAFRAPDSTDRFGYGGNPSLRPETSRNLELGVRHNLSNHETVSLTAYDDHIDNLVVFVYTTANPYGINANVGSSRIRGVEANWQYTSEEWRARIGVAHQEPVDADSGMALIRRTRWNGDASGERVLGAHEIGMNVHTSGLRPDTTYDVNYNPVAVSLGGYTLVAATWRWSLSHAFSLRMKVDNLFDKRYEYISGYNTARRSISASVRYDFH
jgi:vitamin B12 transporter